MWVNFEQYAPGNRYSSGKWVDSLPVGYFDLYGIRFLCCNSLAIA